MKALDNLEPTPLSPVEEDICRVLQQEMNVAVTPCLPDGVLTLHLVMGKTVLQVLGIAKGGHREWQLGKLKTRRMRDETPTPLHLL